MRNFLLLLAIIVIGISGYFLYTQKIRPAQALQTARKAPSYVVKPGTLRETLTLSGKIDADEKATLSFPMSGRLTWVGVKRGDGVKKYQGIASIDSRTAQKQIEQQLNNFMTTRWQFDQTKDDNKDAPYKDGYFGDKLKRAIDISQFGLNNSILQVEIATIAKEASYLWSPIDGVVVDAATTPVGSYTGQTTTYTIVNPETLRFVALADQTEVSSIRTGQGAEIAFDAYQDKKIPATIQFIGLTPKAGESGTVYEVFLTFPTVADREHYRLGMTGDAEFILKEKKNVLRIPLEYVKTEGKKKIVTIRTATELRKQEIKTGLESDGFIEILSGLTAGDTILEEMNP